MSDPIKPSSNADVEAAVKSALAAGHTLDIIGSGSKRAIGRAAQWDLTLDLSALTGVTLYEPDELVLSAKAATPLADIEALVAAHDQQLAFEPMDYGPLLGLPAHQGTIGGMIACNLAGPRRVKAGAARDHFLGFSAVSGRGETFKSGGRVVKNVTGYDLPKLMAGSWGTLAVMTDVTIKVLPKPETEQTLALSGLDDARAVAAMNAALGSLGEVSAAAHLPAAVAARLEVSNLLGASALTVLRLEGVAPSIRHRFDLLRDLLRPFGKANAIEAEASQALWRAIRDATPFAAASGNAKKPLWRISVAPMQGAQLAARVAAHSEADVLYDWAGGLVWLQLAASDDAGAAMVRPLVAAFGGHATLVRASPSIRAAVDVFQPPDPGVAMLSKRVKDGFDPKGVLNPGRIYAGV
jgi:glycolate oxidase FAD binding subunit